VDVKREWRLRGWIQKHVSIPQGVDVKRYSCSISICIYCVSIPQGVDVKQGNCIIFVKYKMRINPTRGGRQTWTMCLASFKAAAYQSHKGWTSNQQFRLYGMHLHRVSIPQGVDVKQDYLYAELQELRYQSHKGWTSNSWLKSYTGS